MPDDVKDGIGMPPGAVAKRLGVRGKTLACQRRGFDSLCSHQKKAIQETESLFSYNLPRTPGPLLPQKKMRTTKKSPPSSTSLFAGSSSVSAGEAGSWCALLG